MIENGHQYVKLVYCEFQIWYFSKEKAKNLQFVVSSRLMQHFKIRLT